VYPPRSPTPVPIGPLLLRPLLALQLPPYLLLSLQLWMSLHMLLLLPPPRSPLPQLLPVSFPLLLPPPLRFPLGLLLYRL